MKQTLWGMILERWAAIPPVVTTNLTGKTIIVTGSNIGLGLETARHFARMNPGKLILACRSKEKGLAAVADIKRDTGCSTVEFMRLDLADFDSVKSFVHEFKSQNERLDILVENAAVALYNPEPQFTKDGWELTIQVNHLASCLLGLLLLPILVETAKRFNTRPRVVVVTSGLHERARFEKKLIDSSEPLRDYAHKDDVDPGLRIATGRYSESKLLNVYFARALHERLPPQSAVIVNSVTPGLCYSGLRRDLSLASIGGLLISLMEKVLARTTEEGSRSLVFASLGEEKEPDKMKGAYLSSSCAIYEPSDHVLGEEGAKEQRIFWDDTVKELTKVDPQVEQVVKDYLR
ncbi:short-chain dehydrogenase [Agrocybe pediades]|nr:short-chain dehydrogenase [Agrocybe pediades]